MKRLPIHLSLFRKLSFGFALFSLALAGQSRAGMISPAEILADGPVKKAFETIVKDPKAADATTAVGSIRKTAEAGDKDAQFTLAFLLMQGVGGGEKPDPMKLYTEAKELYKKAGEAGQQAGFNNLGLVRLLAGEDAVQSVGDIQRAADRSYGKARITLAQLYLQGTGVEKNLDQSIRWLERAEEQEPLEAGFLIGQYMEAVGNHAGAVEKLTACADKGHLPSMIYLGGKLLNATGVPQDIATAQSLFAKAEAKGDLTAIFAQGQVAEAQGAAAKEEAKRTEFFKKALSYYQKASEKKVADAYNKLGFFHENGLGIEKSDTKALEQYKLGAEAKLPVAMFNYGVFLENGKGNGDKKDPAAGVKWVHDAANAGLPQAMMALGERYRKGEGGLAKDPIAGMAWIEKAAGGGHVGAKVTLANMLQTGEAGFVNLQEAAKKYGEAVNQGEPVAAFQLAGLMEAGQGVPQDLVAAYALYGVADAFLGKHEQMGPQVKERFTKLKDRLTTDQVKQGEAALEKLMGGKRPAPAAPAADTKEKDKGTGTKVK